LGVPKNLQVRRVVGYLFCVICGTVELTRVKNKKKKCGLTRTEIQKE